MLVSLSLFWISAGYNLGCTRSKFIGIENPLKNQSHSPIHMCYISKNRFNNIECPWTHPISLWPNHRTNDSFLWHRRYWCINKSLLVLKSVFFIQLISFKNICTSSSWLPWRMKVHSVTSALTLLIWNYQFSCVSAI